MTFTAKANSNGCDPSQSICEEWLPGNYTVDVGELGSMFPGKLGFIVLSASSTVILSVLLLFPQPSVTACVVATILIVRSTTQETVNLR